MGGVINILTRPPTNTPQAVVEGRYGTDNTYQVNGFVSAPLADHLSASLNVDQFDTDGYFEVPPHQRGPIDRKTLADAQTLQGQVMYHPLPDLHLSIRGNYYNSDQPRNTKLSKTSTEVWYITSGLRYDLNPGSTLSADFFYGDETFRTDNTTSVPFGSRLSEFVSNAHRTPSDDVGGSLRWSKAFGRILQDLTVGVDVRRISGKDDADIFNEEGDFILRRIGKGEQLWVGGFGEVSYFPLPRFEVLASVRQDYFKNYSGSERENEVITKFKDRDFNETNYRLALRYALTDQVALRGAGYSGFRAPTLAELYRTFGTATFIGRSNANLKPETLNGGEVGLDLDVAACGFTGQITGFYNSVENFVGSVVVLEEPFTLQNTNLGRIRSRGVEITGTQQLWERVWLTMSYTFTDSTVVKDSELKGNWVEGTPRHFIGGNLTYRAPFGLTVEVRGRYLSRQFQDISNETKLGPHAVFDVSASYAVNSQVDLFFIGENIFDRDYAADNLGGVTLRGVPLQVFGGVRFKLG
jgi:outer membrane receptor protein involved in Fe transport